MPSQLRSWLSHRVSPSKRKTSQTKSPFRLALLQLEERLNPSGPTFDYKFTEAAIGSIVTVYGVQGQAPVTAVADHLDASEIGRASCRERVCSTV